jgi:hypothetical protein
VQRKAVAPRRPTVQRKAVAAVHVLAVQASEAVN